MKKNHVNIIPMAGLGSRFANEGYLLPKPLIEVSGVPMIIKVIRDLPPAERHIFIVRQEHLNIYGLAAVIRSELPEAEIIPLSETTDGQATTCLLGLTTVDDDQDVFIAACDNGFLFDAEEYDSLRARPDVDSIYWTFTEDPLLTAKPEAWGWVQLGDDGETIEDMSVKVPVSADPFHDHAVVASFYFKRAGDFKAAYDTMKTADHRINGELYVDALPTFLNRQNKRTVIFDVDLYVGWGKPADLYQYQQYEFLARYFPEQLPDERWKKYFQ